MRRRQPPWDTPLGGEVGLHGNGYDRALLEWALSPGHLARFDGVMARVGQGMQP